MSKPSGSEVVRDEAPADLLREAAFTRVNPVRLAMPESEPAPDVPLEEQPTIKVFSRGGMVAFDGGMLLFPESPEVHIEVFVIQPGGGSICKRYQGAATPWVPNNNPSSGE